jgi:hypothetical protein
MLNSRHRETICARRRHIPSHEEDVPRPAAWLGSSHPVVMGWSRFTPPRGAGRGLRATRRSLGPRRPSRPWRGGAAAICATHKYREMAAFDAHRDGWSRRKAAMQWTKTFPGVTRSSRSSQTHFHRKRSESCGLAHGRSGVMDPLGGIDHCAARNLRHTTDHGMRRIKAVVSSPGRV